MKVRNKQSEMVVMQGWMREAALAVLRLRDEGEPVDEPTLRAAHAVLAAGNRMSFVVVKKTEEVKP